MLNRERERSIVSRPDCLALYLYQTVLPDFLPAILRGSLRSLDAPRLELAFLPFLPLRVVAFLRSSLIGA